MTYPGNDDGVLLLLRSLATASMIAGCSLVILQIAFGGFEHIALPLLSFGVLAVPVFSPRYRLLSTWTFVLLVGFIGLVIRPVAITLRWPDEDIVERLFLLGRSPEFFIDSHMLFFYSSALLVVGYLLSVRSKVGVTAHDVGAHNPPIIVSEQRWRSFLGFVFVTGAVSFIWYAQATGGLDLQNFSRKRTLVSNSLELDEEFRGFQVIATINRFAFVGFFVALDHMMSRSRKLSPAQIALLGTLLANAVLLGIYRSERLPVLVSIVLSVVAISAYGRRLNVTRLVRGALVTLLVFQILTAARTDGAAVQSSGVVAATLETLVENRNMIDPSKTAHIVDGVPDKLDFENGSTITSFVVAPIPRSVWPTKPIITPGPTLGRTIFGTAISGVPPGLFAELYWNFGILGIGLGVPIAGTVLGRIDSRVRHSTSSRGRTRVIQVVVLTQIGPNIMGISIGQAILSAVITSSLVFVLFALFGTRHQVESHDSREIGTRELVAR